MEEGAVSVHVEREKSVQTRAVDFNAVVVKCQGWFGVWGPGLADWAVQTVSS